MVDSEILSLLAYCPLTGFITWRDKSEAHYPNNPSYAKSWNKRFSGTRAGSVKTNKDQYRYREVKYKKGKYSEHRIAWALMTGESPPEQIDHINQDSTDNRWRNLTASSPVHNSKNRSIYRNNTSGKNGVYWSREKSKWKAVAAVDGKKVFLGYFDEKEKAFSATKKFRDLAGFSVLHGSWKKIPVAQY